MTLEEGIIHAEDVARMNHEAAKYLTDEHPTQAEKCEACADEHRQLAEWLKELKAYRNKSEIPTDCGDAISRKAAIDLANELKDDLPDDDRLSDMVMSHNEGILDYQTKLSLLPSVTPQPCEDAISRQAVFEQIAEWIISGEYGFTNATDYLSKKIKALPSVTPQQRTGEWIERFDEIGRWYECDQCHTDWGGPVNYCPNCGCKMEVKE